MKVIYKKLPSKRKSCIATVGVFDGVHLGHQFILKKVILEAKKQKIPSLVITFDIPPKKILNRYSSTQKQSKDIFKGYITDFKQKAEILQLMGFDYVWFLKTGKSLLSLSAENFIIYILRYFDLKKLIVGEDFRFGYQRRADLETLKSLSVRYGFKLSVLKKIKNNTQVISSSRVRKLIQGGKLKEAAKFLGRYFSLEGKVIKGEGIGFKLGFPTANVLISDHIMPLCGVYSAYVIIGRKIFLGAVNIGVRPTLGNTEKSVIEAHLINFKENILGKTIEIIFLDRIRREQKFSSLAELQTAIKKDIDFITAKYSIPSLN